MPTCEPRTHSYMFYPYNIALLLVTALFLSVLFLRRQAWNKRLPFPPGPKGLPIIGNILNLPTENESARYYELAQRYGDLVFMTILDKNILVVNTFQAASDLFDKRGANYSDRNVLPMINDLMGWDWSFGHMPYGERWKIHRQMFHRQFQSSAVSTYRPIQLQEAHKLIRRILDSPTDLIEHLRFSSGSTIMNVVYGININDNDNDYIAVAETALDGMARASHPGAFLVDIFPILKYIPACMPFMGFKRKALEWKKAVTEMRDAPFNSVRKALIRGTATSSFVANAMSNLKQEKNKENMVRDCAGLAYAAGTESITSSLSSFILALTLYPEVQTKAQKEIDTIVGPGRLPDFNDMGSLPYIDAIIKEILRWSPVAPLGLPHMVTRDDEYNGYFIPAGTTIMGNTWTILHDPQIFPEPDKFSPDRFLDAAVLRREHVNVAFGYGRRICPGRFMAEAQLWISVACILSVFNIMPGDTQSKAAFASGMICHPLPFEYRITTRGERARTLIEHTKDSEP